MEQFLELSLVLTPPPSDSSSNIIASIALHCDSLNLHHKEILLHAPLTQQEQDDLRWYFEEYWKWPYEQFGVRGKKIEALLQDFGRRLYEAVFGGVKTEPAFQSWLSQDKSLRQINIISTIPEVLSLPWELFHDKQGFLALHKSHPISIVRCLSEQKQTILSKTFEPPLRILLISPRPVNAGFVDPRSIARELIDEVQSQVDAGAIEIEFLRPPTFKALRERLDDQKRPVHVLHFDGHGMFDKQEKHGMLAFENDGGWLNLIKASDMRKVLQQSGVRLVVLTACQSAVSSFDNALSSVAAQLLQGESAVDAVVAMSASLLTISAARYAEAFYHTLSAGMSAQVAHEQARQALYNEPRRHLHQRRKDEEGTPVEVCDWWLPHFYYHRPLTLLPLESEHTSKPRQQTLTTSRLSEDMPITPRYSFVGRAYELLQIERSLLRGQLVVISGFGGIGKTALAREAADWFTLTKLYKRACFISFEYGGDASMILSVLGNYLGIYDSDYDPNDQAKAIVRLRKALNGQRILVIADNLENILSNGNAALDAEAQTQLWNVLLEIADEGAGILLISRDTAFDDIPVAPGKQIAHLVLNGLKPEDAYVLATRLLDNLQIDRAHIPYVELRDFLIQLDHHPLAIQLVLPKLRELPLSTVTQDFAALLPMFVDNTIIGRNRSLMMSLNFSLQYLNEEQRTFLPRLAIFEGGANETELLLITEIPQEEWAKLRTVLEQSGLLTVERIHIAITSPFLRFHPVLSPFLRSLPFENISELRLRYSDWYYRLINYLDSEDDRNPQPTRILVRRELPNLRRAFELLLERESPDGASMMANILARFLAILGFQRERDKLWQQLTELVSAKSSGTSGTLTLPEWLRESGLGDSEIAKGDLDAALERFTKLLSRIEAQPLGASLGPTSYEHCVTLQKLARCLQDAQQLSAAEVQMRKALMIIKKLIKQRPENQILINTQCAVLSDLGNGLIKQGQYEQAQKVFEEVLQIAQQQDDLPMQAHVQIQLSDVAKWQGEYVKAKKMLIEAFKLSRILHSPDGEVKIWFKLGIISQSLQELDEAERYYRESLELAEQLGNAVDMIAICNELALNAWASDRHMEVEGWYKHALDLAARIDPDSPYLADTFNNIAAFLLNEVQKRRTPAKRLIEAQQYAEQALAIREKLGPSSKIWTTFDILANIAQLEGDKEKSRKNRRHDHESYASFIGNRSHIDRHFGEFIAAIAAAATGDKESQAAFEANLPELESAGFPTVTIQRILMGERDWFTLTEDIDRDNALLVLRILETLAQPREIQVFAPIFMRWIKSLSPEAQLDMAKILSFALGERTVEELDDPEVIASIEQFEPLILRFLTEQYKALQQNIPIGENEQALKDLDEVIELHPTSASIYIERGRILLDMGKNERALKDFDKAIECDPTTAEAYILRGEALLKTERFDLALAAFDRAIECDPILVEAHICRGAALLNIQQYEAALTAFDKAIEYNPVSSEAYRLRGWTLFEIKQHGPALEAFEASLKIDAAIADTHYGRASILFEEGQYSTALEAINIAITLAPDQYLWYRLRGMILSTCADYLQAREAYSRAIELAPNSIEKALILRLMSEVELKPGGNLALAKSILEEASQLEPDAKSLPYYWSYYYRLCNNLEESELLLLKAIENGLTVQEAAWPGALLAVARDEKNEAERLVREAFAETNNLNNFIVDDAVRDLAQQLALTGFNAAASAVQEYLRSIARDKTKS